MAADQVRLGNLDQSSVSIDGQIPLDVHLDAPAGVGLVQFIDKLPMNFGSFVVSVLLPCIYFFPDYFYVVDSSVQALTFEDVQLYLGHIKPATVFRGVHSP